MKRQILVPLDGSALAETILPHAAMLARLTSSGLTLLRAAPPPLMMEAPMGTATPSMTTYGIWEDELAQAWAYLGPRTPAPPTDVNRAALKDADKDVQRNAKEALKRIDPSKLKCHATCGLVCAVRLTGEQRGAVRHLRLNCCGHRASLS